MPAALWEAPPRGEAASPPNPESEARTALAPPKRGIARSARSVRQSETFGSGSNKRRPASPASPGHSRPAISFSESPAEVPTAAATGVSARASVPVLALMWRPAIVAPSAGPASAAAPAKAALHPLHPLIAFNMKAGRADPWPLRAAQISIPKAATPQPSPVDSRVELAVGTALSSNQRLPATEQRTPSSPKGRSQRDIEGLRIPSSPILLRGCPLP